MLKIVFKICCGIDVHKDFVVACIAKQMIKREYRKSCVNKSFRDKIEKYQGGIFSLKEIIRKIKPK